MEARGLRVARPGKSPGQRVAEQCRQLDFRMLLVCTSQCVGQGEFWFYFKTAPEDVNTGPEDADEVCREISLEIELLGFQPLIRFA
jgi:hypothetical protein